jgi:hypothetical protein
MSMTGLQPNGLHPFEIDPLTSPSTNPFDLNPFEALRPRSSIIPLVDQFPRLLVDCHRIPSFGSLDEVKPG